MGWEGQTEPRVLEVCAGPWGGRQVHLGVHPCCPEQRSREEGEGGRATEGMLGIHFLFISENLAGHGSAHL